MIYADGNHFIGGKWVSEAPNGYEESRCPASRRVLGRAPRGSTELANRAIEVARDVFESDIWATSPRKRSVALLEFAERMEARKDELAELLCRESGKILPQAQGEVAASISEARYYAGVARNLFGRTFESGTGKFSLMTRST